MKDPSMDGMSGSLVLAAADRLLILAPHPDDESIATGGLIQVARSTGAAVRVIVLTDGDNNPWPQRWIEKRWRIDVAARARWGARRREEARAAMRVLGLGADDARFLGLPDLGLTDLLMRNDQSVIDALRGTIEEFSPTLLVLPALSDRHPDHSAAHILTRLALSGRVAPRLLTFGVHGGSQGNVVLSLNSAQRETKANAILAHASQMTLSRGRFLGYASDSETFDLPTSDAAERALHPLRARLHDGALQVRIDAARWRGTRRGLAVFIALDDGTRVLKTPPHGDLGLTLGCAGAHSGYVKLARPQPGWRVFDRHGWQAVAET